jgi:hypothetical protein
VVPSCFLFTIPVRVIRLRVRHITLHITFHPEACRGVLGAFVLLLAGLYLLDVGEVSSEGSRLVGRAVDILARVSTIHPLAAMRSCVGRFTFHLSAILSV